MPEEVRVVGKNIERIGAYEKAKGEAIFVDDMRNEGMLCAKILRSPYAHAKILSIDTSKAKKLPGIKAVLTYKNVPRVLFQEEDVSDAYILEDKVRFLGDEVAAVAGETPEIAERAIGLIKIKYEEIPAVFTAEEALNPGAPLIPPPEVCKNNLFEHPARTTSKDWGDINQGFREAEYTFEETYIADCV